MFFKKKKKEKPEPQVIEILGKVEVQPPKNRMDGEATMEEKVAYLSLIHI